jgi:hypothetical protein
VPTAAERRRTPIPADERLTQVATMLDPAGMTPVLARSLGREAALGEVAIRYLRYRPGKNLVVHYEVEVEGAAQHAVSMASSKYDLSEEPASPLHRERVRLIEGRSPAATPFTYDGEVRALVSWLPFDPDLPTLAQPPSTLRATLEREGIELSPDDDEPEMLQYRPRRRATMRLGSHVVKLYRYEADFEEGMRGLEASDALTSIRAARGEAIISDLKLTVQELLSGTPPVRRGDVARDAGAVLAGLHASDLGVLPVHAPEDRLRNVGESVKLVSAVAPQLAERAQTLFQRLEATPPRSDELVPSHGDFHGGQLLELAEGGWGLIDFDLVCSAAPALDLANYAGHLVAQEGLGPSEASAVLDGLVEGYGRRPDGLSWYLGAAVLRSARGPFKRFEPDWPARMETTVAAAEAALDL